VAPAKLLAASHKNKFCGPDCNLSTKGDLYKAIEAWTNARVCP
jgi:hypothetical protein